MINFYLQRRAKRSSGIIMEYSKIGQQCHKKCTTE